MKIKNKKYNFYILFAAYIAIFVVFLVMLFQIPRWFEKAEMKYVTHVQEKIHQVIKENDEKYIKEKLIELRKEQAFEIALYDGQSSLYQSISGVKFTDLRSILAQNAVVYETQGTILGKNKEYSIWYSIYHPTLQVYINNLFTLQTIFIFIGFIILLAITIFLRNTMRKPLEEIQDAIQKLETYQLEDFSVESDDVISQRFERFAHNLYDKIRVVSREHTELEYALQAERERLQNTISVSRGIIHDLKSPLHQTLIENDYLLKQNKDLGSNAVAVAKYNIHRMEATIEQINDVLNVMSSDVQALTQEYSTFDIVDMYKEIRQSFLTLMEEREISLYSDVPETLEIAMNKVVARLIIHNMISNAVKYAKNDTEVDFMIDKQQDILHFECSNEATMKNIERIQRSEELFFASRDEDAEKGDNDYIYSTGNGVYLIKELVRIVGGNFQIITNEEEITIIVSIFVGEKDDEA